MDCLVLPTAIVDFRRAEVRGPNGARIDLRSSAFAVLRRLAEHAGQVVSKDDLLADCWPNVLVTEHSLTQSISAIRQALGEGARDVVRTVPRRGYMLVLPDRLADPSRGSQITEPSLPHVWPGVAVLPFEDLGAGLGSLGACIAAEITMELARNRELRVLGRYASFAAVAQGRMPGDIARDFDLRYLLEGTVRSAGKHILVNVQLIDGRNSCHVWAEQFAAPAGAASVLLGRQAATIAARVFSVIRETESFAASSRATKDLSPAEFIQRGFEAIKSLDRARYVLARAELLRVIDGDPGDLIARRLLSALNGHDVGLNITGALSPDALSDAIDTYEQTLDAARPSALGYQGLGFLLCLTDRKDEALTAAKKSLELGPSDTDTLALLAYATIEACDYEAALSHIRRATALSPSKSTFYDNIAAYALMGLGQHAACLTYATEAVRRTPGNTIAHINVAHALSALGRKREAEAGIAELLERSPGYTLQTPVTQQSFLRDSKTQKDYLGRLRDAGLPGSD